MIWRVRHRRSFQAFRGARRSRSGPLAISWVPDDPGLPPRVAFSIGRGVGSAVTRNRLRRRLRELLRETAPTLPPGSYLIAARREATELSFSDLGATLREALCRLPVANGTPT
ncbi:MAG: ribonuclease P protein component [Acidimicrobiaceae bacterium]|nr:ribonuclease P protein component [Acidimicrobiaceae bacterium]